AEVGDRQDGDAVAASSTRREGGRRVGHGRCAAGNRQRRGRCTRPPRRHACRHSDYAGEGVEHPAREGRSGVAARRGDFPLLHERFHGKPLVYLDNAATTQKPAVVIERLSRFYEEENANVQRGVYALSERATSAYESARATVQRFLNAASPREIVFVRGTTEAINLVAAAWGRTRVRAGDEILVSEMEHHSNIVPWQIV